MNVPPELVNNFGNAFAAVLNEADEPDKDNLIIHDI